VYREKKELMGKRKFNFRQGATALPSKTNDGSGREWEDGREHLTGTVSGKERGLMRSHRM
jgi:hypothetical protein